MPKDVIVVVDIDAKPKPAESLDIMIVTTKGRKDVKLYRSLDEVKMDYPETTVVYKKVAALFNQGKTTLADSLFRKVKIVGVDVPKTAAGSFPVYSITFSAPNLSTALEPDTSYWLELGGNPKAVIEFKTGTSAPTTATQMASLFNGLVFVLNGITFTGSSGSGGVVTFTGDIKAAAPTLTGDLEVYSDSELKTTMGLQVSSYTANYVPGAAPVNEAQSLTNSIEAIRKVDDDWYIIMTDLNDDATVSALAAWAEASEPTEAELGAGIEDHRKLYFFQTDNKALLSITNRRAIGMYTDDLEEQADAAYLGNVGPFYPVSVTWKFKRPQGLTLPDLTDAQREALEEAHVNFLTEEYKRVYVKNGTCCDGEFIDVQMGADYIARDMRERLYDVFLTNPKVPFTDLGFALIANAVFAALDRAVTLGIIARDPESEAGVYNVSVPRRADATDEQARARRMPDIVWEAQLEGAIHSVKVKGTLRATLSA